jgi:hypothetical protein
MLVVRLEVMNVASSGFRYCRRLVGGCVSAQQSAAVLDYVRLVLMCLQVGFGWLAFLSCTDWDRC